MTESAMKDKRIKECAWCGGTYRDKTRPGNRKTCSKGCGDSLRKRKQRDKYREENPHKPNQREEYYYAHHEYSFWLDNRIARNNMWKSDVPYDPEKIEEIQTAMELEQLMGGRKKRGEIISYNGDEKGSTGVHVRFADHNNKEPGPVTEMKMSRKEIERYLAQKYGV